MRLWLVLLLSVGLATAFGMQFWRGKSGGAHGDGAVEVEEGALGEGAAADSEIAEIAEAVEVDPAPRPSDEGAGGGGPKAPRAAAAHEAGGDPETEVPGGAATDTAAELRRRAAALVEQAGRSQSAIEQAKLLSEALRSGALDAGADAKVYELLLEANRRGILHPLNDELCMRTEVKKGDSLWTICRRIEREGTARTEPGLVRLVNGLASDSIYPGTRLKIPTVPLVLVVEKSRFRLSVWLGDVLLRRYAVGLGKDNGTPEGEFTIASRLKDPQWYKPGVGPIPADDPDNILGSRWLGFAAMEDFPEAARYGIHGTRDDSSIGKESSAGCVRMHNGDVNEIFEWVAEGVKTRITR